MNFVWRSVTSVLVTLAVAALAALDAGAADPLPIVEGDVWTYFKGTVEPPPDWNTINFDDSSWDSGPTGIGYGDGDDATVLSDMKGNYMSVYARREFNVPNASGVLHLTLFVDYDDSFVAYLNGTEVARANVSGNPPAHDVRSDGAHEARLSVPFVLDPVVALLVDGTNVLAVQGHNDGLRSSDLTLIPELEVTNVPPGPPTNDSPLSGALDVPAHPLLCVDVSDPNGDDLDVSFFGVDTGAARADDFAVIALPDTQFYAESYPQIFDAQTQWIVGNRSARNVVFTTQLGDCVENGSDPSNQLEWDRVDASLSLLEDPVTTLLPDGIPWGIAPGNHDQSPLASPRAGGDEGATTDLFNQTFGVSRFQGRSYYRGSCDFGDPSRYPDNNDNNYEFFSAGHYDFVITHLEYDSTDSSERRDVLDWLDTVLETNAARRAIIASHLIIRTTGLFDNQGQAIYDEVKDNPNVFLMLGAHSGEGAHRADTFNGNTIHSVLSNYSDRINGGNGWLRINTFSPQNNEIHIETYSPWLDQYETGVPHEYLLPYDMDDGLPFAKIGNTVQGVASGGSACMAWPGRQSGVEYQWFAMVSDGSAVAKGQRWSFTSNGSCGVDSDCDSGSACATDETCVAGLCVAGSWAPDGFVTQCGAGACAATGSCTGGVDSCVPGTAALRDISCDGIDDDCDGLLDEDYVQMATSCGVGACVAPGITSCVGGAVQDSCVPGSPAADDATCNAVDDDCDGLDDEDYPVVPTTCGIGACEASGTISCVGGIVDDSCAPGTPANNDATCNGVDDDCDDLLDEDYISISTSCGLGICMAGGATSCVGGAVQDDCVPGAPGIELCDDVDNDCDGTTDEDDAVDALTWYQDADTDTYGDPDNPIAACSQRGGFVVAGNDCDDSNANTHPGAVEFNDGQDNQCDGEPGYGIVDEISPMTGFYDPLNSAEYSWPAQPGATLYEVKRSSERDFNSGCTTFTNSDSLIDDPEVPVVGGVFHYLVRSAMPHTGSWGTASSEVRTDTCP